MKNIDSNGHVRGESLFIDDIITKSNTLHAAVLSSVVAHANQLQLDISGALSFPGVEAVILAKDIPGENQIGGIIFDEPLLAEDEIHFQGQPLAIVVAESNFIARQARKLIKVTCNQLPVITTAKQAKQQGGFINPPRSFGMGDVEKAFAECDYVFEDEVFSNGQEHLYLETQGAYAERMENGCIKLMSSTQGPTVVQRITARVLGVSMNKIEVDVTRLGGGFGGKEDQATPWACMVALATHLTQKPVKLILDRHDDLKMTGKRHPYESSFKIGLDKNLKIKAFQAEFLQNSGAAADLSPAIAERTLFHATNSYFIPNVKTVVHSCKTNLPPNTAFRGFGGPQGKFVIESAIVKAAEQLNIPAWKIQKANLLQENDELYYGQIAENVEAQNCWSQFDKTFKINKIQKEIDSFNDTNKQFKKGMALMPICFGISFTNTPMNHARALVHIYQDGSVGISTGAVEMGQGVNTKMLQIAAQTFSIPEQLIKLETTNTTRVANTSPSAASSTADLNGKALLKACQSLLERLKHVVADEFSVGVDLIEINNGRVFIQQKETDWDWNKLVFEAFWKRVCLTENAHYATPKIQFDKTKEKGHPFAYHVYGLAAITTTVDCLLGTYEIDRVKIVHDFGQSMNPGVDMGQVEGALAQGIGWMTMEEIAYNNDGKLLSNALSTYKIPDVFSIAKDIQIESLKTEGNDMAILKSKAVGEPPLMYGIGAYFAINNAIKAFNPQYQCQFHAPMTPEKVLMRLYGKNSS
ncbi:MAG TPA: molybdopterin-dependent oxidoreductase [Gammaproteobacteria bacterium]|nr:molybdopterin-dependent oxidoreductase [Xanthomonadales bacterium]MCB1593432.1 molybdopterin-dependent oxidoreductase [Xanthomonadales bacterium]HOP21830.1 molybdopterin-dependent oxidoreductase [Gammaproteobacteria bacterium]HPI96002.1 molybdopterin-dependent oxidoreductase [Gammaproteobacteria bacterium]